MEQEFIFGATPAFEITKSYRDENGQMYVEGIASTTGIDLTKERMSPEAIGRMAARAIGIPLRSEHGKGWDDKLGEIIQADVIKDDGGSPALWIKARLYDWSSKAKDLFALLKSGTAKMGLSVAGHIKPGGIVKELVEGVGKFIPTYKDVQLTEVSVTDHPANLGTFAVAVSKSLNLEEVYDPDAFSKDVTNAHEAKPKEYKDVTTGDFLDGENHKYPADDKHLMPALKYFNHSGQRSAGEYSEEKWASMGRKLASKLSSKTEEKYTYDADSEKVTKGETKKTGEEVNDMNNDKRTLASKEVSPAVASFAKEWGHDLEKDGVKVEKSAEEKAEVEKAAKAVTSSTDTTTSTAKAEEKTVAEMLKEISSTLSSMSSTSAKKADASSSTTTTTSTAKAEEEEEDELGKAVTNMGLAFEAMKKAMGKKKPAASATSETTTSESDSTTTSKAITELAAAVQKLTESHVEVKKSLETLPLQRKGYAVTIEKKFQGHEDVPTGEYNQETLNKLAGDKRSNFNDVHFYKTLGKLPTWFEQN